jgi:hypothetical protein
LSYDPEREYSAASYRTKQLIVLAADVVIDSVSVNDQGAACVVDRLVHDRLLPACYRSQYDEGFLEVFRVVLELTRNLLVSDTPFLFSTASELAAHAILAQAKRIATMRGAGVEQQAGAVDERLAEQLAANGSHLGEELEALEDAAIEDTDVLILFDVAADNDPGEFLSDRLRPAERRLLHFEHWLEPFGPIPRPHITYDGRAWPVPF